MNTGERIKAARLRAGLTQKELADRLGIPYQGIGQWERGVRIPKESTLRKLAPALGVTYGYLIGLEDIDALDTYYSMQAQLKSMVNDEVIYKLSVLCGLPEVLITALLTEDFSESENLRLLLAVIWSLTTQLFPEQGNSFFDEEGREMQKKIFKCFLMLNDEGRRIALGRMEELTEIPKYREVPKT